MLGSSFERLCLIFQSLLAIGLIHQATVLADNLVRGRLNRPRLGWQISRPELSERPFAYEADAGTVFFVVHVKAEVARHGAHFRFHQIAQRK